MLKIKADRDKWKQRVETQQIETVAMDTPVAKTANIKNTTTIKCLMCSIRDGKAINTSTIINGCIQRPQRSPDSDNSIGGRGDGGGFHQLGRGAGGGSGDDDDDPDGEHLNISIIINRGRVGDRGREFTLLKSINIIINTLSRKNLSIIP